MNNWVVNIGILICFILGLLVIGMNPTMFHGDMGFWQEWATNIKYHGLSEVYQRTIWGFVETNYHPVFLYFLDFFGKLFPDAQTMQDNIYWVKSFAWIFDVLTVIGVVYFFRKENLKTYTPFLILLNPAFWYNSLVWGQVDSIYTFFVVFAILFLARSKVFWSMLLMTLAILTKPQTIMFFPVYGLMLLVLLQTEWRKILMGIAGSIILIIIVLMPFILQDSVDDMLRILLGNTSLYPYISVFAYNFWFLLYETEAVKIIDTQKIYSLTYKMWGIILYVLSSLPVLFFLVRSNIKSRTNKLSQNEFMQSVVLASLMSSLLFFYFFTQMHERYSHPVIILSFIYFVLTKKPWLYILCSIAYLINLEYVANIFQLEDFRSIDVVRTSIYSYTLALIIGFIEIARYMIKDRNL